MHAQALGVSLTTSNYNGYAISCSGVQDGWIIATVSGGTPPYQYTWSQGSTGGEIADLPAGYYHLAVVDADSGRVTAEVTLMQPPSMKVDMAPAVYPNGYNISCWNCFNGSLQTTVTGGVPPYSYLWTDSATTPHRTGLGHKLGYMVTVTDSLGCMASSQRIGLTQPERNVWAMDGNSATDAGTHYLGTTDSSDLVLKSNGQEALRLTHGGGVQLQGLQFDSGYRMVYVDSGGVLKNGLPTSYKLQCPSEVPWMLCGNEVGPPTIHFLGSTNAMPLTFRTDNVERLRISTTGKVGIGTVPPAGDVAGYRLFVEDGIATRDVLVKLGNWPDYVFAEGYRPMPMKELREFLQRNRHLPGIPAAAVLEEQGGVAVGEMQRNLVRTVEEQTLYILELEERLLRAEERLNALEQRTDRSGTSK